MPFSFDALRPFIAKLLGPIFGAIIGGFILWLKVRWGIHVDLDNAQVSALADQLVNLVIVMISTGISSVFVNKKVNPGNAASSHLAAEEKEESKLLKVVASRTAERRAASAKKSQ